MGKRVNGLRRLGVLKKFLCVTLCAACALSFGCAPKGGEAVVITPTPSAPSTQAPPATVPSATPRDAQTPVPADTPKPTDTPRPADTPAPTSKPTPTPKPKQPLAGRVIGLDPGHQAHSSAELEPVAPGSSTMKKKVSSGTRGVATRVYEYEVNLAVGLLLRDMLEAAGATVLITHTKADVDMSNIERAEFFNDNKVELGVRLHCNGNDDHSVRGAFMLVPKSKDYPYYNECVRAAKAILKAYGEETGLNTEKGITYRSDQTGFNWCTRPVTNIEMGHMTNPDEDRLLTDSDFQVKMARGIYNGIVAYFSAP